jgi:hypothetical protein
VVDFKKGPYYAEVGDFSSAGSAHLRVFDELPEGIAKFGIGENSFDNDIEYFYPSRLPGEPAEGIEDIHLHPVEPRTLRGYVSIRF